MKIIAANLIVAAGFSAALAGPPTETKPAKPPFWDQAAKNSWQRTVSAGVTLTRGNKQTARFTADFLAVKKTAHNEYSFGLAGAYGSNNSTESLNQYKAFGQWNQLFDDRFYGYLRADALRDHVADLDYRFNLGPGMGYYFFKSQQTMLAGEAGVAYEAERLGDTDFTFATFRLADRFEHKLNPQARLWQSCELQPEAGRLENYVVNFEVGVETSMTKTLKLKTYLEDIYQNRPAAGRKKNDLKIVAALAYKF